MRKLLFTLVASLLCCAYSVAQPIMGYTFISSEGTYTEITDGTKMSHPEDLSLYSDGLVWMGSTTPATETTTGAGFDIGFDFHFNNVWMNKFAIGSNFALFLGKDEFTVDPTRHRWFLSDRDEDGNMTHNIIQSALSGWRNVEATAETEISYKLVGEAPAKTLVVQYKNMRATSTGYECDLQIRLNQTTNTIDIIYSGWNNQWTEDDQYTTIDVAVGIKGGDGDALRLANGDDYSWKNVITTYEDYTIEWSMDNSPADGLTFTFVPGPDCVRPTVQPTDLQLNVGSTVLSGSFTPVAEGEADGYIVLLTPNQIAESDYPVDNVMYKRLDKIGNSIVLSYGPATEFTTLDRWGEMPEVEVLPETEYIVTVLSVNSLCSNGPLYNYASVLQSFVTSAPSAPEAVTLTEIGLDYAVVTSTANEKGQDVIIAYTDIPYTNDYGTYLGSGLFGTPDPNANIGDEIEGGGKVVYSGPAGESVRIDGLDLNKVYYFAAWSKNAEGVVSSVCAYDAGITTATLPYEFAIQDMYCDITVGRDMIGASVDTDINGFYFGPAQVGGEYIVSTQWIRPEAGTARIIFDMNMYIWGRFGSTAYNEWTDDEKVLFETTTDGQTWTAVAEINKDNAPSYATYNEFVNRFLLFDIADETPIKFRVRWIPGTGQVRFYLKDFRLEMKKDCDYPVNLTVKEAVGDKVTIAWEQQGTETEWLVDWRVAGTEAWNTVTADRREYTLEGLPGRTNIEVRVAAKCSANEVSDYSKTITVTTGYVLPFVEQFTDDIISSEWEFVTGELTDTGVEFSDGGWYAMTNRFGGHFIMLEMPDAPANAWVLTPVLNFGDGSVNYNVSYKLMSLGKGSDDEQVKIVVSTDGGQTFTTAGVVLTDTAPGDGEEKEYTATLKGYQGQVRIGLLVTCATGTTSYLQLASVSVTESCPNDAVVTVDEIQGSYATVSWTGTKDDDQQWMVYIRKAGETDKNYQLTSETSMTFEGLEPRTTYEVGVTKACADDDIARPATAQFTTLASDPCLPLETINVTPGVFDLTLQWESDAYAFNIRCRKANTMTDDFIQYEGVQGNSFTISNLDPATDYLIQMQTVCSLAEGDQSDWTTEMLVSTLEETCFAPTDIVVEALHNRAVITWAGEAPTFEVSYRLASEEDWTVFNVSEKTTTLYDLTPETSYQIRLRSICEDEQVSRFSEIVAFSTTAIPECVTPSNLRVENILETSATLLWDADQSNISWLINWRDASVTSWNEVFDLTTTSYQLENLQAGTAYIWRVKANCEEDRQSGWATQNKFSTQTVGVNAVSVDDLTVYGKAGVLSILNAQHIAIDNVAIYALNGALIGSYDVNTTENVLIPTAINDNVVLVSVRSGAQVLTFKVALN